LPASPYDCSETARCGLPGDGANPKLVLGRVLDVADETEAMTIFHWARDHGYWSGLPDDAPAFAKAIQVMSVEVPAGSELNPVTLLMGRKEFNTIGIASGDFVRHAPHPLAEVALPGYPNDPKDPYWAIFGCIAVLCRADDVDCPQKYQAGIYDQQGLPIDPGSGQPLTARPAIDPITYLPREHNSALVPN